MTRETYPESENVTEEELMRRIKFTAGFTNRLNDFNPASLPYLQEILTENRFDVQLTMKKLMYPCSKLMFRCRWEGNIVDCKDVFAVTETYQGYCCSFNMLKPVFSEQTANKTRKNFKTQYFGPKLGLSVVLEPLIEPKALTTVSSDGIKILINERNLYPSERTIERLLPHKHETYVEVRPEKTDCSSQISALPISDRGCVFENEHSLRYVNCESKNVYFKISVSDFFRLIWKKIVK